MPWFDARWDSRLSRSAAQSADHGFDELLEGLERQSRNLSDHQDRAGRKQLARPREADGAKRTGSEARWCQVHGSWVAVRVAGDLTEDPIAAASVSQDDSRPQLRLREI
jgi:hypothetical protein